MLEVLCRGQSAVPCAFRHLLPVFLSPHLLPLFPPLHKQETGQLQVMMEMCLWDLILFAAFFLLADIGFTLAFYTLINGTTSVVAGAPSRPSNDQFDVPRPFYNIGYGMVQVLR